MGPVDDPLFVCVAYPRGIPDDIIIGKDKHAELRGDEDEAVTYQPGGVKR